MSSKVIEQVRDILKDHPMAAASFNDIFNTQMGPQIDKKDDQQNFMLFLSKQPRTVSYFQMEKSVRIQVLSEFSPNHLDILVDFGDNRMEVSVSYNNLSIFNRSFEELEEAESRLQYFFEHFGDCPGLVCSSYGDTNLDEFQRIGENIYFPKSDRVFGMIFKNPDGYIAIRSDLCSVVKLGKKRYCVACSKISKYISNQLSKTTKLIFRNTLDTIEKKKEDQSTNKRNFEKSRIAKLLKEGFESGKIGDDSGIVKLFGEQVSMASKSGPKAINDFTKYPNTLQSSLSEEVGTGEGLNGHWVDDEYAEGGKIFVGNFIKPTTETINHYISNFAYGPGLKDQPSEIMFIVLDALQIKGGYITISGDGAHLNQGFVRTSIGGIRILVGGHDYGAQNQQFIILKDRLERSRREEKDKSKQKLIDEVVSNMKYIDEKEQEEIRFAKTTMQMYVTVQADVDYLKYPLILHFPNIYFFESSTGEKDAAFMFRSTAIFLHSKIMEGRRENRESCMNLEIDSMLSDSDPGVMSHFEHGGHLTEDVEKDGFELPYVMKFPVENINGKPDIITAALSNDVEHLLKETKRDFAKSTGLEGGKLILFPVLLADAGPDGRIRGDFMPVSWRVIQRIYQLESMNPKEMKISKITKEHLDPKGKHNMKTHFARHIFNEKTIVAIDHFLLSKFIGVDDEKQIEMELGLRKREIIGTRHFIDFIRLRTNILLRKYPVKEFDLKKIVFDREFLLQWYKEIRKNPKTLITKHCLRTDLIKKMIRSSRTFEYLHKKRKKYVPYSSNSDNCVEQSFAEMRKSKGGVRNPRFSEYSSIVGRTVLKKSGVVVRKTNNKKSNSYSYASPISFNEILFKKENIEKMKKMKKADEKKQIESLESMMIDVFELPTTEEKTKNWKELVGDFKKQWKKRVGVFIRSATNTAYGTNRSNLGRAILEVMTESANSKISTFQNGLIIPNEKIAKLFYDMDLFVRKNFSKINNSSYFKIIEDLYRRRLRKTFNGAYRVLFSQLRKKKYDETVVEKTFILLVDAFVSGRLFNILKSLGSHAGHVPGHDKDAWRDQKKFKDSKK